MQSLVGKDNKKSKQNPIHQQSPTLFFLLKKNNSNSPWHAQYQYLSIQLEAEQALTLSIFLWFAIANRVAV